MSGRSLARCSRHDWDEPNGRSFEPGKGSPLTWLSIPARWQLGSPTRVEDQNTQVEAVVRYRDAVKLDRPRLPCRYLSRDGSLLT